MSSSTAGGKRKVSAGGVFQTLIVLVALVLGALVVIVPLKLNEQLNSVWGSGKTYFAVGDGGTIIQMLKP